MTLRDDLGRDFRYLRFSVTEHCNFRCSYCLPSGYQGGAKSQEFLALPEVVRVARAFAGLGVEKVRLTGGEPTLRADLCELAQQIKATAGVRTVALSTNGHDLFRRALEYKKSGITHLNVSLDDVDAKEFFKLRGTDRGELVVKGIESALECGFTQVKVNAVLMKEGWLPRLERFVAWVKDKNTSVRFIELMQTAGREGFFSEHHLSSSSVHRWLIEHGWVPQSREDNAGPSLDYSHPQSRGKIGIIAPYSKGFCDTCNRLRVSCRGDLQLCLFGSGQVSLRDLLQRDDQLVALQARIVESLRLKKPTHYLHEFDSGGNQSFSTIGG